MENKNKELTNKKDAQSREPIDIEMEDDQQSKFYFCLFQLKSVYSYLLVDQMFEYILIKGFIYYHFMSKFNYNSETFTEVLNFSDSR